MLLRILIAAVALGGASPPVTATWHVLGRSADGRPIRALELRGSQARTTILVVGCIHGNECAALPAIADLERSRDASLDLWLLPNLNPDGFARGTRQNGRGVDLNRNFPSGWRAGPRGLEYPGPRPLSERESRIATKLILRIRPQLTIWFHQPQGLVRAWGPSIPLARVYAHAAGMLFRAIRWPNGTAPNWQNHRFPGCASFVVELQPGPLSPRGAAREAHAVLVSSRAARC